MHDIPELKVEHKFKDGLPQRPDTLLAFWYRVERHDGNFLLLDVRKLSRLVGLEVVERHWLLELSTDERLVAVTGLLNLAERIKPYVLASWLQEQELD